MRVRGNPKDGDMVTLPCLARARCPVASSVSSMSGVGHRRKWAARVLTLQQARGPKTDGVIRNPLRERK